MLFKDPFGFISAYLSCKSPSGRVVELRSGLKICLSEHPHDVISVFVIFVREDYGRIQPGSIVVDVGANIGIFSLYAAQNRVARVFAYEPNSESYDYLLQNIKANHLDQVIVPGQFAVVDTPGEPVRFPTKSSMYNAIITNDNTTDFEWVSTIGLPEILDQTGDIHLLKLDCEGAEYSILFSAGEDVYALIQNIRLEYHLGREQDIENYLVQHGFVKCYSKVDTANSGNMWYEKG
ncbi:MAG: FkbM family methyltransferase [Anaerolineae bacterium]|nr:FkbM family methyltransferase [Anaerolineae bacterium]